MNNLEIKLNELFEKWKEDHKKIHYMNMIHLILRESIFRKRIS